MRELIRVNPPRHVNLRCESRSQTGQSIYLNLMSDHRSNNPDAPVGHIVWINYSSLPRRKSGAANLGTTTLPSTSFNSGDMSGLEASYGGPFF